jgi:bifunctional oligoribonuclease and PAP phosphatase NrnA
MCNNNYKYIYKKIKKYDNIVIARHVGADPDGLASQIALRDVILNTFPHKKVYAIGYPASKFKYIGILDKFKEEMYDNSLLIVLDTPDKGRVDGVDTSKFKDSIKIDHHPFIEKFCNFEWIDEDASSAAQMIVELINNTKLKMTKEAAEKLFIGIVADTNRFLFYYTTPKTFKLVSELIESTNLDFTGLYESLYLRPLKEVKFQGYVANHFSITENGLAYIKINDEILKEFDIDAPTARNMVAAFNYIEDILVWIILTEEANSDVIKGSIRSRGPIVNETASNYKGGGHIYASGVRLSSLEEIPKLVNDLDLVCKKYREVE